MSGRWTVFAALAAGLVLLGAAIDGEYAGATPDAAHAQGRVVDFLRDHARSLQPFPVVEFTDAQARTYRVVNPRSQRILRLALGDTVPVAYSRANPQQARIDTPWFSHRGVLAACAVAVALAVALALRGRSRR